MFEVIVQLRSGYMFDSGDFLRFQYEWEGLREHCKQGLQLLYGAIGLVASTGPPSHRAMKALWLPKQRFEGIAQA